MVRKKPPQKWLIETLISRLFIRYQIDEYKTNVLYARFRVNIFVKATF
jgi:hypothetical protein